MSTTSSPAAVSRDDTLPYPSSTSKIANKACSIPESQVDTKPTVIGVYGLPGSGKSFLLNQLKRKLGNADFVYFEGSEKIASLVPGGLEAFHQLSELRKSALRQRAIDEIGRESAVSGRTAVAAGHFMFWPEGQTAGQAVYTPNDLDTFTHIIYLDVPVQVIAQRRLDDKLKKRPSMSADHLRQWKEAEVANLRHLCRQHHILFIRVSEPSTLLCKVSALLQYFQQGITIESNLARVAARLDDVLSVYSRDQLETVLVMDADKTLGADDAGTLFWRTLAESQPDMAAAQGSPLKELFSSRLGYSDVAFHQATLLCEEAADDEQFEALSEAVVSSVRMHPDFIALIRLATDQKHIGALVVTCGLARVWEKVLEREGLSKKVSVIGGGRIADGFVVTAGVKAAVVSHLRNMAGLYVWAFGDSPLDLPMLRDADQAVVVVGDEHIRSSSMDAALYEALQDGSFQARQVLLPSNVQPRLDEDKLPLVRLDDQAFINSIIRRRARILHGTETNAAKLLMSRMRDASVAGPALREVHRQAGWYLATEFVSRLIGVEEYTISHVQGHQTSGYRLQDEHATSIVALMRGGEPMALGVNDAFPGAMFIHAANVCDIKPHHLDQQRNMILVDSVVNSGKSLTQFINHIRGLHASIRIVVVAGVVQAQAVAQTHDLTKVMRRYDVSLTTLRLSENKFTGTKTTDTGNRLFNTTHLA